MPANMDVKDLVTAIKDVLLGVAAATTAIVAVSGLKSWRRELQGKAEFEVARNLIRSTYYIRDELSRCRSPLVESGEFPPGYVGGLGDSTPEEDARAWSHVYQNRWIPLHTALQDFDSLTLEAEAIWGVEIRDKTNKLRSCVGELRTAIESFIDDKRHGGRIFTENREFGKEIRSALNGISSDKTNSLSNEILESVNGIEQFIRPHLRRN